jgi:AraC-like DNA-binding protein
MLVRPPERKAAVDVLSEVLRAVRLTGALYFEVNAAHPWVALTPSMRQIGAAMMPGAEHVIPFHIMVAGHAWAMPEDRSVPPMSVESGDVLMFPFGASHIISSDGETWNAPPANLDVYFSTAAKDPPFTLLDIGGGGEPARFVCGYLGCDASPFNPLLGALPKMIVVKGQLGTSNLMKELLQAALAEKGSHRAGAESVLAKVSELMFVQAIRQHMDSLESATASWLSGLRDEHVGKALQLIHAEPAKDWSLERLAKESGLSRSAFAERFTRLAGESPMHYVGRWRMQLAAGLLAGGSSIGSVADDVGYSSEAAFQRAFKKYVGVTPGEWRKRSRPPASVADA